MNGNSVKPPVHLWIVGLISLLWNSMGAFDYSATELRLEFYMAQFTQEQLDYFYGFPAWTIAAWAIAVWSSLFGSIGLLLRKRWAVWMFGLAIAGLAITTLYNLQSNGFELMGDGAAAFTAVIWVIALLLLIYSSRMAGRKVLK
jgi:hypothetical protein